MTNGIKDLFAIFVARIRDDKILYIFIGAYTAVGLTLLYATKTMKFASYAPYIDKFFWLFVVVFPFVAMVVDLFLVVHRFEKRRMLALRHSFSLRRIANILSGIALLMTFTLFQGTFTSIKNAMFVWQGRFLYDKVQADIDQFIHFGYDPWRLGSGPVKSLAGFVLV
jgi:hypothetical protein